MYGLGLAGLVVNQNSYLRKARMGVSHSKEPYKCRSSRLLGTACHALKPCTHLDANHIE